MDRPHITRTRALSFAVPVSMDGAIGLVQTALPLLAIRFGASAWFLGMLWWTAQTVRLPCTIGSGILSDRIGRTRVILPAAAVALLACVGFALAENKAQILVFYILFMAAIGAFYPSLQAFIGDHSPKGELRKNLSWFNVGWAVGGSVCTLAAGYLLAARKPLPFVLGAVLVFVAIQLVFLWSRAPVARAADAVPNSIPQADDGPGPLLFIARVGHFLGFFGYAIVRSLFPKLGVGLGMTEGTIGLVVGMMLVGHAAGIFVASAGPWWRGKLWPQILAQAMSLGSALMAFLVESPVLFAVAFLVQGSALGIAYAGALYYGLQARTNMGRSTGIHESLVAAGLILGAFAGGSAAQFVNLRAPYLVFAAASFLAIVTSLIYWRRTRTLP